MVKLNPNTGDDKNKVPADSAKEAAKVETAVTNSGLMAEDNEEYYDKRSVIISLVHNYSNYRKVNMKVLGQRKETIGSSISSCQILSSNSGEVQAYFPTLVGLSPNNPEFITRVKAWLSNIKFVVNDNDASLDISFIYKKKSDYRKFKAKEEQIEQEFSRIDRSNISTIKEAVKRKVDALNALESQKYLVGRPVNVEQYIIYRHCLLYKDVAKDMALINSDPSLRFYIKDETREAEKRERLAKAKMDAMRKFLELNSDEQKFNAVYVAIVASRNENVSEALLKERSAKLNYIMDFVNQNPDKFNRLFDDKNIGLKAFIETLIVRGELTRAEFNQQISTADGTYVGSNMAEAVAFFSSPANKAIREVYENKLKMF